MAKQNEEMVEVKGEVAIAIEQYAFLAKEIAALTEKQDALKKVVAAACADQGEKLITPNGFKATWVAETVRVAVDQKRLADEMPEVFKAYAKESKISASVRILSPRL